MTARPIPRRHWRSDGTEPLLSGAEAMGEPFAAFPSWFLRIECDRCGKVQHGQRGREQRSVGFRPCLVAVTCAGSTKPNP